MAKYFIWILLNKGKILTLVNGRRIECQNTHAIEV